MIYLHVGLHKTGTTFLQEQVFPRFRGIEYIPQRTPLDRFLRLDRRRDYLISNERLIGTLWCSWDEIERSTQRLSELFPGAGVLIGIRPHEEFIVSSYKQFLHKGGALSFERYFDIDTDRGRVKRDYFLYAPRISLVAKYFGSAPFVMFRKELNEDLEALLCDLGSYLHADPPSVRDIDLKVLNPGVKFYQAKLLRALNALNKSELNPSGRLRLDNRFTQRLRLDPRRVCQYWLSFIPDREFLTDEQRERIRSYYRRDWECVECWQAERGGISKDAIPGRNAGLAGESGCA